MQLHEVGLLVACPECAGGIITLMTLTVTTREQGGWAVVTIDGEGDIATEARIHSALQEAAAITPWLVVDCAALAFFDSSFLRALVNVYKQAQAAGGTLVIAAASNRLEGTLDRTGLDQVVSVYPSVSAVTAERRPGTDNSWNESE